MNAEPLHTPGQWEIFRGQRGRVFVRAMPADPELAVLGGPAVCQVVAGAVGDQQAAANALLIAAAPELYAALRTCAEQMEIINDIYNCTAGDEEVNLQVLALANAALAKVAVAKAEGSA